MLDCDGRQHYDTSVLWPKESFFHVEASNAVKDVRRIIKTLSQQHQLHTRWGCLETCVSNICQQEPCFLLIGKGFADDRWHAVQIAADTHDRKWLWPLKRAIVKCKGVGVEKCVCWSYLPETLRHCHRPVRARNPRGRNDWAAATPPSRSCSPPSSLPAEWWAEVGLLRQQIINGRQIFRKI